MIDHRATFAEKVIFAVVSFRSILQYMKVETQTMTLIQIHIRTILESVKVGNKNYLEN